MGKPFERKRRGWIRKFGEAFLGIKQGMIGQSSFYVHLPVTVAVLAAAVWLQVSIEQWCLLVLCVGLVLTAELINTSIEVLAQRVTDQEDPLVAKVLHVSSGAVLVASITAATVGAIILGNAWQ